MNKKILIIDDDEAIVDAITAALELKEYQVIGLGDAKEAVTVAQNVRPDLILLDFLLSGTDGKTVALEIKKHAELKDIPIIMLSAHPNANDYAREAQANDFLPKPFDLNQLWNAVEKQLSK